MAHKGLNLSKRFKNLLSGSLSLILNKMGMMHQYGSLGVPQTPKSHDALIEVFKFIRNKLHFCTYIESETLKIYFGVYEPFRRSQLSVRWVHKTTMQFPRSSFLIFAEYEGIPFFLSIKLLYTRKTLYLNVDSKNVNKIVEKKG